MLLAFAFLLAFIWVITFLVSHVSSAAIHVLLLGAAVSAVVHFIHIRRAGHQRQT